MQKLFAYWHVAHLPFALIMFGSHDHHSCSGSSHFWIQMDFLTMEELIEKLVIYLVVTIFIVAVIAIYLYRQKGIRASLKLRLLPQKEEGMHEPVTLHPVIDVNSCIKSGACITACPEKDIIGIKDGKATIINASHCIGHGACFHACPVQAITLFIGTEKRGVSGTASCRSNL